MKKFSFFLFQVLALPVILASGILGAQALTLQEELGKAIFFNKDLSFNGNQACADCHGAEAGWTGPDANFNAYGGVYEGSIAGRFGNRKPPASAYMTQSPILHLDKKGNFVGGNFWDGRATGERLGSPAAEQAQGPFLNPLEQALSTPADVVNKICTSMDSDLFRIVCGDNACDEANVSAAYDCVGYSVAAFEASPEVNQFSSKYDAVKAGKAQFSKEEQKGLALFMGKGKCNKCHVVTPRGKKALFTDFTYDNLGVPKNPENPFYSQIDYNPAGTNWIDLGLGGFLAAQGAHSEWVSLAVINMGKHKVPTLRNVDKWDPSLGPKVKAYSHNGYFKSLKSIVHFYNTRDVLPVCPELYTEEEALAANCWPEPEVAQNLNMADIGDLGLSNAEEDALVSFLETLSDGYVPQKHQSCSAR
ncbi:MAG: cytochrome c peroxidase [Desulfobulbaceae bacterium]|nr:cytochrome c peroxidase [Desulfobulbaceae bacterium]